MPAKTKEPKQDASNPLCPACRRKRLHTLEERKEYHPEAKKGFDFIGERSIKKEK